MTDHAPDQSDQPDEPPAPILASTSATPGVVAPPPPYARLALPCLLLYWPLIAIATHLPPSAAPMLDDLGHLHADKLVHFGAFALLTALLLGAAHRMAGDKPAGRLKRTLGVAVVALLYACIDEYTQRFVGRTPDLWDLLADATGVLCVALASLLSARPVLAVSQEQGDGRFVRHAMLTAALTVVSRITGLVRDAVLAAMFGLGAVTDAFFVAFMAPNLFRRLFGEGALSAAFIPAYTELLHRDPAMARKLATACTAGLVAFLAVVVLVGEGLLYLALQSRAWSLDAGLAIELMMLMLPYTPMVCAVALAGGLLQVHGRFGPQAIAPILLNLIMIAVTLLVGWGMEDRSRQHVVYAVAGSVLFAGVVQVIWVLGSAWRLDPFALRLKGVGPSLRRMLKVMVPMVLGLAVLQINTLMDSLIAMGLSPKELGPRTFELFGNTVAYPIADNGAVGAIVLAQRLYQFPIGVFAVALAVAIFPTLTRAAVGDPNKPSNASDGAASDSGNGQRPGESEAIRIADPQRFTNTLRHGLQLTMFIGLPATLGLILVRQPLARLMFERGAFEASDTQRVTVILVGYATVVWAFSMTQVLTRAFYAMRDAKTPLRISIRVVLLNLVLNLTLVWFLGAAGLAWSTAISALLQTVFLLRATQRHIGTPIDAGVWRSWRKTALLTGVMSAALLPVLLWIDVPALSATQSGLLLGGMVLGGAAVFSLGAALLRMDELRWLLKRNVG